jgi:putative ubiquitin-RnfH superfamily antitoxin RatB of RatAB toxin-antitoxin module
MRVEVAYARPEAQVIVRLEVEPGTSAQEAIRASGLLQRFPDIDLAANAIGIFAKPCGLDQTLRPGDRVEIYRPLQADPREARRLRAMRK